ncbi:MAG: prepilin-type N-terminal cleavage/methylation domain-containing protein [Deltaproteobacteria bacterium]
MKKLLQNRKDKGFTLIELMIVVAIIGILAAIAIPNFIRYQMRSKQSEGRTNVRSIKTSQESFRATEDNYAMSGGAILNPPAAPTPAKQAWSDTPCASSCNRRTVVNCSQYDCIGFKADGAVYFQYETRSQVGGAGTEPEFCVGAAADLDGDGINAGYEFQSINGVGVVAGVLNCAAHDGQNCAAGMPDGEIFACEQGIF